MYPVNPKPTIGKPCDGQRNVDNVHGTRIENEKQLLIFKF